MSKNARPAEDALLDDTLRRSGVRDWSGENEAGNEGMPPNPRQDIMEPQVAGRTQVVTDIELHLQHPPSRIDRLFNYRTFGYTAPIGMGGFQPRRAGEYMRVGHVPMAHANLPVSPTPGHGAADNLHIPATRIGDPL